MSEEVEGRLARTPFIYRKVGNNPVVRAMIMLVRASAMGCRVLYEIVDGSLVDIAAVRQQFEDDHYRWKEPA